MGMPIIVRIGAWAAGNGEYESIKDANGTQWRLGDLKGWYSAGGMRNDRQARAGQDGFYNSIPVRDGKNIEITGFARVEGNEAALLQSMDDFRALLAGDVRIGMMTVEEQSRNLIRQSLVYRDGELMVDRVGQDDLVWSISLASDDPNMYGPAKTVSGGPFVPSGGAPFSWTWPLTFGPSGAGGQLIPVNNGNARTFPVVSFFGPCVNPRLQLVGGPVIQLNVTLGAGDVPVVVDMGARTVTQGGNSRPYFVGDFFGLPAGASQLLYTTSSGAGLVSLSLQDAWL